MWLQPHKSRDPNIYLLIFIRLSRSLLQRLRIDSLQWIFPFSVPKRSVFITSLFHQDCDEDNCNDHKGHYF